MTALILIAGGSAAGKSLIGQLIAQRYADYNILVLSHDNYYKDLSLLSPEKLEKYNFDHPESIDSHLLISHIKELINGGIVEIPRYDFIAHRRFQGTALEKAPDIVILEGIFALYYEELLRLSSLSIFVDTDPDIRLARRMKRDIISRGFTVESVLDRYLEIVKPMHDTFIEPTKKNADIIIPGEKSFDKILKMLDGYFLSTIIDNIKKNK